MKLLALVVALLLTGCSTTTTNVKINHGRSRMISGEFTDYVNRFKQAYYRSTGIRMNTNNVIIKPIKINKHIKGKNIIRYKNQAIGFCILSDELPAIYIDSGAWKRLPDLLREELIFHELGHCILRRLHCNYSYKGIPVSIMRSHLVSIRYYLRYRNYYISELFEEPACRETF